MVRCTPVGNADAQPPEPVRGRRRGWLRWTVFAMSVTLSLILASLWGRSFFARDIFKLGVVVTGDPFNGSESDWWIESNHGDLRLNLNHVRWQSASSSALPVRMGQSSGPGWYSTPASRGAQVPTSRKYGKEATGFDIMGVGAGRYLIIEGSGSDTAARSHNAIRMPHWIMIIISMLPAAVIVRRFLGYRRRLRRGLCVTCGYDLRGGTGRCPECGTVDQASPHGRPVRASEG